MTSISVQGSPVGKQWVNNCVMIRSEIQRESAACVVRD